jgi:hypothetical protein
MTFKQIVTQQIERDARQKLEKATGDIYDVGTVEFIQNGKNMITYRVHLRLMCDRIQEFVVIGYVNEYGNIYSTHWRNSLTGCSNVREFDKGE